MQNRIREWWIEIQAWRDRQKRQEEEKKKDGHYAGDGCPDCGNAVPKVVQLPMPVWRYDDLPEEVKIELRNRFRIDYPYAKKFTDTEIDALLDVDLMWVIWGVDDKGVAHLAGYQFKGANNKPTLIIGPNADKMQEKIDAGMIPGAKFDPTIVYTLPPNQKFHPGAT